MDNEQLYQSMPGNLTFLQGCAASLVGQDVLVDTKALEAEPITVARLYRRCTGADLCVRAPGGGAHCRGSGGAAAPPQIRRPP